MRRQRDTLTAGFRDGKRQDEIQRPHNISDEAGEVILSVLCKDAVSVKGL
jgi:hypothetical protein